MAAGGVIVHHTHRVSGLASLGNVSTLLKRPEFVLNLNPPLSRVRRLDRVAVALRLGVSEQVAHPKLVGDVVDEAREGNRSSKRGWSGR